jgi:hypothetical protein
MDLNDFEIERRTGFPSLCSMLSFIVIVYNGNIDLIVQTSTELMWIEEWMLYFEMVWGKFSLRWVAAAAWYHLSNKQLRQAFDKKIGDGS